LYPGICWGFILKYVGDAVLAFFLVPSKFRSMCTQKKGVLFTTKLLIGIYKPEINQTLEYAEENNIDLIVVGTRGRSGFKKLLLGSIASSVVTCAHCPVMVVK
jgi:hypothetical protein